MSLLLLFNNDISIPPALERPALKVYREDTASWINFGRAGLLDVQAVDNEPADPASGYGVFYMTTAGKLKVKMTISGVTKTWTLDEFTSH